MSGPPECAGAPARASGAAIQHFDHIAFPVPLEVAFALSALTWREGVARFVELGLPLAAFAHSDAELVAAALLGGRRLDEPGTPVRAALERVRPGELSIAASMLCLLPTDPVWAVHAVECFALAFAARWLPDYLDWCAARLRRGEPVERVVADLDELLAFARPTMLARAGKAAA